MNFIVLSEEQYKIIMEKLNGLASQSNTYISDPLSQFISNEALAQKLNLSTRTLQRYRDNGLIKFYQLEGRKIYYKVSEVLDFIHKHGIEPFNIQHQNKLS